MEPFLAAIVLAMLFLFEGEIIIPSVVDSFRKKRISHILSGSLFWKKICQNVSKYKKVHTLFDLVISLLGI